MRLKRRRGAWSANQVGVLCALVGLFILIGGYNYPQSWWLYNFFLEVYPNSGADLIGASIVILLVDRFARQRDDAERRRQLIRECGSTDHAVANRALLELEARGWLAEGCLAGCELTGANLAQAGLESADLSRANLVGAKLQGARLSRAMLTGASLGHADMSYSVLEWALLSDAGMSGANLHRADAAGAVLERADLTHSDLSSADLTRANLSGADLTGANLCGTNLTKADLEAAIIATTQHDQFTRWPAGYLPPNGDIRSRSTNGNSGAA